MAADVRRNFTYKCNPGQINFVGKLMVDLFGFGKLNRLAIVLVQEDSNKILGIVKTESSTGKAEAEAVKKALDEWEITEKIIACGHCFIEHRSPQRVLQAAARTTLSSDPLVGMPPSYPRAGGLCCFLRAVWRYEKP